MNNTTNYNGYVGSIEFSEADGVFYGKILGIRSLISYEGAMLKSLKKNFMELWMIILMCVRTLDKSFNYLSRKSPVTVLTGH